MHKYNPHMPQRKSIRLRGYDYSRSGLYFVTICCQNRACLFGEIDIKQGEHQGLSEPQQAVMVWNDAGKMIEKWYYELEHKFPDI